MESLDFFSLSSPFIVVPMPANLALRKIISVSLYITTKIKSETNTFSETAEALISASDKADTKPLKAWKR